MLTEKQARFVQEYLADLNAAQAAVRAGYSPRSARNQGPRLLAEPEIQAAVRTAEEERRERTGVTQDQVVKELSQVAFAQAADCSASELKYASKLKALELLGKHLGMFDGKGGGEPDRETGVALLPEVRGTEDGGGPPPAQSAGAPFIRGPLGT